MADIDIKQQIQLLAPSRCSTQGHRNEVVRSLNNQELTTNASKRIRLKAILHQYFKEWQLLKPMHYKEVGRWNAHDLSLHVVTSFIINPDGGQKAGESPDKESKRLWTTWRFLNFLVIYFKQSNFDGKQFVAEYCGANKAKSSGFGLNVVKKVSKCFNHKTGQYTKVKKALSHWAKEVVHRRAVEVTYEKFTMDDFKGPLVADTPEPEPVQAQQQPAPAQVQVQAHGGGAQAKAKPAAKKAERNLGAQGQGRAAAQQMWYWFCDEGDIKWIPYRAQQQKEISAAWDANRDNVVVMERFKIDFDRSGSEASGTQYNYQIHNSWRRGVIRGTPDQNNMITGVPCEANPR